jgi:hypothetical protein
VAIKRKQVIKSFIKEKEVASIQLDPLRETSDIDTVIMAGIRCPNLRGLPYLSKRPLQPEAKLPQKTHATCKGKERV